jgi:hypothetical protein
MEVQIIFKRDIVEHKNGVIKIVKPVLEVKTK